MCGIFGLLSVGERSVSIDVVARALRAMWERGTEHGAGFALIRESRLARVKVIAGEDDVAELDKLLNPLEKHIDYLGQGLVLYTAYVEQVPSELYRRFYVVQASRYLDVYKDIGRPDHVIRKFSLYGLESIGWVAHTRYPTNSPGYLPQLAHPFSFGDMVAVHNGDLSSYGANKNLLIYDYGERVLTGNDSEVVAHLLAHLSEEMGIEDAVKALIEGTVRWARLDGPYAVAFIAHYDGEYIMGAFVDKHHFRPLYLGISSDTFIVASEAAAIKAAFPDANVWMVRGGDYLLVGTKSGIIHLPRLDEKPVLQIPQPPSNYIDASGMDYQKLNMAIAREVEARGEANVINVLGHRYIASGLKRGIIRIWGVAGNASANLLHGAHLYIYGDAQDDLGDTMNDGLIAVYGDVGDAVGQAKRGGDIYVAGNAGNRAGIQMRGGALIIGGCAGDYLGEYMGGGVILVWGCVGRYIGTGMVRGRIYIRGRVPLTSIGYSPPKRVLDRYLRSLADEGLITEEQLNAALSAQDLPSMKRALGDAYRYVERLLKMQHFEYPNVEYRYLTDDEIRELAPHIDMFRKLFGKELRIEEEKFTIIYK